MGRITVIYGNTVHTMMQQLLTATAALSSVQSHDRVIIKPNLVVSQKNWQGGGYGSLRG